MKRQLLERAELHLVGQRRVVLTNRSDVIDRVLGASTRPPGVNRAALLDDEGPGPGHDLRHKLWCRPAAPGGTSRLELGDLQPLAGRLRRLRPDALRRPSALRDA